MVTLCHSLLFILGVIFSSRGVDMTNRLLIQRVATLMGLVPGGTDLLVLLEKVLKLFHEPPKRVSL